MKKILSLVLALAVICSLVVSATAANFGIETDKDFVQAGETVTVTVTLDEAIPVSDFAVQIQGKLNYDTELLTYVSNTLGEGYSFLTCVDRASLNRTQFSWVSMTSVAVEMPAGTVISIDYIANEGMSELALEAAFTLKMDVLNVYGQQLVDAKYDISITVCPGHEEPYWPETIGSCEEGWTEVYNCIHCGMELRTENVGDPGHEKGWYEPTENADGSQTFDWYCANCGEFMYSEVVWPGDKGMPYEIYSEECPATTLEVAAGKTVHYNLWGFGGFEVTITGENFSVIVYDTDRWGTALDTYTVVEPVDGVVSLYPQTWSCAVAIVNNGSEPATYTVDFIIPVGDLMNPYPLEVGENVVEVPADCWGYYTQYVAQCTGKLVLTFGGEYWNANVTNYGQDRDNWRDDRSYDALDYSMDVNSLEIEVVAGDIVEVNLASVNVETYEYPASTITVDLACDFTHEGHIQHVEAVEPGCETEGNIEYWYCECCEMFWLDEALTQLAENVTVGASHTLEHVEAKESNCWEDGNIEYWYCTVCNGHFLDEAAQQTTDSEAVKLAGGHNLVHMEAVAPGCHYEGHVEHWYCLECGNVWTDKDLTEVSNHMSVILPELGGDVIHVEAKAPTCTEDGCIEHWYCEHCEQVWQNADLTQLTNHKNVIVGATGHTYGEDGVCTVCGDNPKSGDTAISLAVAAAIISAMSIVALPVVKKHF